MNPRGRLYPHHAQTMQEIETFNILRRAVMVVPAAQYTNNALDWGPECL